MKRIAILMALVTMGAAAFAAGTQEDTGATYGYGYGPGAPARTQPGTGPFGAMRPGFGLAAEAEEATLTGTYDEIDGYPVLRVGGKTYSVGVPGYRWMDLDIEPGDEVTVSGYLAEEVEDVNGHLRVTSAEIDGTEYEVTPPRYGMGPGGAYGHHGYGHGYGMWSGNRMHGRGGRWATPGRGYAPQGYGQQGYGPRGYAPQGYGPQGYGPGRANPRW